MIIIIYFFFFKLIHILITIFKRLILILEYSPEKEKIDLEKLLNNKGFASNNLKLILLIN